LSGRRIFSNSRNEKWSAATCPRSDKGLRIISLKPLIFAARPTDFAWQWPASFAVSNSERLVEAGLMQRAAADQLQSDFRECAHNPNAVMMTPLVLEIIAEKQ